MDTGAPVSTEGTDELPEFVATRAALLAADDPPHAAAARPTATRRTASRSDRPSQCSFILRISFVADICNHAGRRHVVHVAGRPGFFTSPSPRDQ
jgi:hypothetical protein